MELTKATTGVHIVDSDHGVPGQDERDWEVAEGFDLPIVRTVQPPGVSTGGRTP
jgi:hypothetical protein